MMGTASAAAITPLNKIPIFIRNVRLERASGVVFSGAIFSRAIIEVLPLPDWILRKAGRGILGAGRRAKLPHQKYLARTLVFQGRYRASRERLIRDAPRSPRFEGLGR